MLLVFGFVSAKAMTPSQLMLQITDDCLALELTAKGTK
jgi:hypothetical protein